MPGDDHGPDPTNGCDGPHQGRFPTRSSCVSASGAPVDLRPYAERLEARTELDVCCDFLTHVRGGAVASEDERALWQEAIDAARLGRSRSVTKASSPPSGLGGRCRVRIHLLEAGQPGPFPNESRLTSTTWPLELFLIHGPTGAGRQSILDAVCCALFADLPAPGRRRDCAVTTPPADRVPRGGPRVHDQPAVVGCD